MGLGPQSVQRVIRLRCACSTPSAHPWSTRRTTARPFNHPRSPTSTVSNTGRLLLNGHTQTSKLKFHAFSSSCLPEPCARDPRQLQPLGLKRGERSGKPSSRLTRTLGLQMAGQHQPNRAPTDHMLSGLKETIRPMKLRCQNELLSERPITKPFKLTLKTGGEMWRTRQMRSHLSRNLRLEPATLGTSAVPMHQK